MSRSNQPVHARALLFWALPLLLGTSAASDGRRGEPESKRTPSYEALGLPSPQTLATTLLTEFERAYNNRDAEAYVALFDPWVFSYRFSPLDRSWGAPEVWNYAEEIRSAHAMFLDPNTSLIELRLVQDDVQPASDGDAVPIDLDGVWKVTAAVFLTIDRVTADRGPMHQEVRGHLHEFYFRRGTEDEGRAFRIVYWRDTTGRARELTWRRASAIE